MSILRKFPRTPHLRGSRFQSGDDDLDAESWEPLLGQFVVAEEKLDGANCAISFSEDGKLLLQSRGHYFNGSPRERQFDRFKRWAAELRNELFEVLGTHSILYGEWLYAKHTVFYDALPAHFHEFDLLDTGTETFLSTAARRDRLSGLPIVSVPVLFADVLRDPRQLLSLVGPTAYKSLDWKRRLRERAVEMGLDPLEVVRQTDPSDFMEGLYIKREDGDRVVGRFKYVRSDFLSAILDSGSHWMRRPILPNMMLSDSPHPP